MEINIRPMTRAERIYVHTWGKHVMAQSGCIGRLRGHMGSSGLGFYTSWDDHNPDLKTDEFKTELNAVVSALRFDPAYDGILNNLNKLARYCRSRPGSIMREGGYEYGFRADTDRYAYMLRLNPNRGEYNFYIYCYVRDQLDSHLLWAAQGIRFVDPHYQDLFRLADGDRIRVTAPDGSHEDRTCRYISETHMEYYDSILHGTLCHICDFAEQMEKAGNTVIPLRSSLPEKSFAALETTGEIVIIHRGVKGYTPTDRYPEGMSGQEGADALNARIGVSKAQAAAMLAGSMFGWACPGADPADYDEQGRPIKPEYDKESE